jgi:hypothetical protein
MTTYNPDLIASRIAEFIEQLPSEDQQTATKLFEILQSEMSTIREELREANSDLVRTQLRLQENSNRAISQSRRV